MEVPPETHHLPTLHSTIPAKKMIRHIAQSQPVFTFEIGFEIKMGDLGAMG
jgi:hypothetical protein